MAGPDTALLRWLRSLFHMNEEDEARFAQVIFEARKRAWQTALREEAASLGYAIQPRGPQGADYDRLWQDARRDAASIVKTWNKDVDGQLARLYERNRRGNRYYYRKHLLDWAEQRVTWKQRQIATQTEMSTVAYAQQRFREENGLQDALFVFAGPPPVCPDCIRLYGMGAVRIEIVKQWETPIHIGCTHTWRILPGTIRVPPRSRLWVG